MEYWQKATAHLQEVAQGLVWRVSAGGGSQNEGTSVRMMVLLDMASAYLELRCARKAAVMFIQAASLLPAPWRGPGAGAGASSLGSECDVRRVVAYMREYSYDGVFDMESMAALDVANRIRSLAAPTFGILTGGGAAAAAAAAAGPSCRWSLRKQGRC